MKKVCGVMKKVDMDWYGKTKHFVCTEHRVLYAARLASRYYSTENNGVSEGVGGNHGRLTSTMQVRRPIPRTNECGATGERKGIQLQCKTCVLSRIA
jgi:hypothetical protein